MKTILIKNVSAAEVSIDDLGHRIPAGESLDASDHFSGTCLLKSADLDALLTAGTLVINDGTNDLNVTKGKAYLDPCSFLSSNGKIWMLTVDDNGILETTEVL